MSDQNGFVPGNLTRLSISRLSSVELGPVLAPVVAAVVGAAAICLGVGVSAAPDGLDGADRQSVLGFWREVFARPADANALSALSSPSGRARAELGRSLFLSPALSRDGDRACASCHDPDHAFTDGRQQAMGRDGRPLSRNTPTLYNLRWASTFNWDGRSESLEAQALGPLLAANELGGDIEDIVAHIAGDARLKELYAQAFPASPPVMRQPPQQPKPASISGPAEVEQAAHVERDGVLAALSAYTRTLVSPPTRFDAWIAGSPDALTIQERSGFDIFTGKGGCVACHVGWRFSDDKLHDIGLAVGAADPADRAARPEAEPGTPGVFAFKTPTLRAVSETAPYMHDGRFDSLDQVVDHYAEKVRARRGLSPGLAARLDLTPGERADLVAFLKTL